MTTGIGSLLVTGYCVVVHHQEVGEALNIAAGATVLGMVSAAVDSGSCTSYTGMHSYKAACIEPGYLSDLSKDMKPVLLRLLPCLLLPCSGAAGGPIQ